MHRFHKREPLFPPGVSVEDMVQQAMGDLTLARQTSDDPEKRRHVLSAIAKLQHACAEIAATLPYHWTVNGVIACNAKEAGEACQPRGDGELRCSADKIEDLQPYIEKVRALYPDAKIDIFRGECPNERAFNDL